MNKEGLRRVKLGIVIALVLFVVSMTLASWLAPDYSACLEKRYDRLDNNSYLVSIKVDFNEFSKVHSLLLGEFFPSGNGTGVSSVSNQPIVYQPEIGKIVWLFLNAKDSMHTRDKTISYVIADEDSIEDNVKTKGYAITAINPENINEGYDYKIIGEERVCI